MNQPPNPYVEIACTTAAGMVSQSTKFERIGRSADKVTSPLSGSGHSARGHCNAWLPLVRLPLNWNCESISRVPIAQVEELTSENISMAEAWKKAGVSTSDLLARRVELRFTSGGKPEAKLSKEASSPVSWDAKAGLYTVDAPAAKAVVGRCTGRTTVLAGAEFEVKANSRGFAVLTLNAVDGQPLDRSSRLLLAAAGNVENTGMGWNTDHTSVGTQWGRAPTICEGIAAKVTLALGGKAARVHTLDGNGARAGEVPAQLAAGKLSFEIGPQFKTLWYEIVVE